ncbi:MAG: leucine-rich repeat domain-containing protein [Eubacterium sp.]
MKKISKILAAVFVMAMAVIMVPTMNTWASSKKSSVTYKLKDGTLTISGKGKMPSSMTFKKNKKIKKVVIKKGVTSISKYAFYYCKNLNKVSIGSTVEEIGWCSFEGTKISEIKIPSQVKQIGQNALSDCKKLKIVTMPGDFKLKTKENENLIQSVTEWSNIKTINFNTKLSVKNISYLQADNLNIMAADPNYKSINGVIYSKDGKKIVRVPSGRKELVIEDGCTDFCLQSVLYSYRNAGDIFDDVNCRCENLKKITIPQSVKRIDNINYKTQYSIGITQIKDIIIHSKELDSQSIMNLVNSIDTIHIKNIMTQLPDKIKYVDDMYITDDGLLLRYTGNEKKVKIPDTVKIIGDYAFAHKSDEIEQAGFDYNDQIESIRLHNNITEIGAYAFYKCEKLLQINLPAGLKRIGDYAFLACGKINKMEVPKGVEIFGEGIFSNSGVEEVVLPEGMVEIPVSMFECCGYLTKVNIPNTVTVIKKRAFEWCQELNLEKNGLGKNVREIQKSAFAQTQWRKLTIPKTITKIGAYAFSPLNKKSRAVTVEGAAKNISGYAFADGYGINNNTIITYRTKFKNQKTGLDIFDTTRWDKGQTKIELDWVKISGATGYQIKLSSDKNFKKNVEKVTVKKNKKRTTITVKNYKQMNYLKIRPYKKSKGKTIYGKWEKNNIM